MIVTDRCGLDANNRNGQYPNGSAALGATLSASTGEDVGCGSDCASRQPPMLPHWIALCQGSVASFCDLEIKSTSILLRRFGIKTMLFFDKDAT
jgi:hypothetical protein